MQNFDQAVGNKGLNEGKTVISGFVKQLTNNTVNKKKLTKWTTLEKLPEIPSINEKEIEANKLLQEYI